MTNCTVELEHIGVDTVDGKMTTTGQGLWRQAEGISHSLEQSQPNRASDQINGQNSDQAARRQDPPANHAEPATGEMRLEDPPLVSVIMPCLNEQRFIGSCLDSIIATDYPKDKLEVLVIDGMSHDGTRSIIMEYSQKHPFIKLIDNVQKIKPRALNIGIQAAKGTVIIRMDAHALYEPDYISKSVKYLCEYQADNVGGIRKTLPGNESPMAKAIAYSISHPFAVGNALYRTGSKERRWVDTVFGGCYHREIFDKIGLFDESLIRGQDREFNVRLRRSGGKILLSPDIICYYFARKDFKDFARWIWVSGLTPIYISRIVNQIIFSWRNLVPLLFVLELFTLPVLALFVPLFLWLHLAVLCLYGALCFYFAIPIAFEEDEARFLILMPLVFVTTHVLYGCGSLVGIFKPIRRQTEWSKV